MVSGNPGGVDINDAQLQELASKVKDAGNFGYEYDHTAIYWLLGIIGVLSSIFITTIAVGMIQFEEKLKKLNNSMKHLETRSDVMIAQLRSEFALNRVQGIATAPAVPSMSFP